MHGLISDRFLKRFAGNLKHRHVHEKPTPESENSEAGEERDNASDNHSGEAERKKEVVVSEETNQKN